jgi:hypothetical protein
LHSDCSLNWNGNRISDFKSDCNPKFTGDGISDFHSDWEGNCNRNGLSRFHSDWGANCNGDGISGFDSGCNAKFTGDGINEFDDDCGGADSFTISNVDAVGGSFTIGDPIPKANCDGDCVSIGNTDSIDDCDAGCFAVSDADCDAESFPIGNAISNTDCDCFTIGNAISKADCDADSFTIWIGDWIGHCGPNWNGAGISYFKSGKDWVGKGPRLILLFRLDPVGRLGIIAFEPHLNDACLAYECRFFGFNADDAWTAIGNGSSPQASREQQLFSIRRDISVRGIMIEVVNNWGAEDRTCVPAVKFFIRDQ